MSFVRMFLPVGLAVLLHVVAPERLYVNVKGTMADETSQEPELNGCANGSRNLTGDLLVAEAGLDFTEDCTLIGAAGTRIRLDGPISGKKLTLVGDLQFHATRSFDKACLSVDILHVDGTILVENCKNNQVSAGEPGGGASAHGVHVTEKGNVTFRNCSTKTRGGGLAAGDKGVEVKGGVLRFHQCMAEQKGGGLSVVAGNINQSNGFLEFMDCGAGGSSGLGGGLWVEKGQVDQRGGNLSFSSCSSYRGGGMALSRGTIRQHSGMMSFHDCTAKQNGGGMFVDHGSAFVEGHAEVEVQNCTASEGGGISFDQSNLTQDGGRLQISKCEAVVEGGGVSLKGGSISMISGTLQFEMCKSAVGGGLSVREGQLNQEDGNMKFLNCNSRHGGGVGLKRGRIRQHGGSMLFGGCTADHNGGGMLSRTGQTLFKGNVSFTHCRAVERVGGGIALLRSSLTVEDAEVHVHECTAHKGGGIAIIDSNASQRGGLLHVDHCAASRRGGGIFLTVGHLSLIMGSMKVENAIVPVISKNPSKKGKEAKRSTQGGGGLWVEKGQVDQHGGNLSFSSCSSYRGGGIGLFRSKIHQLDGSMSFHHCIADEQGAGMSAERSDLFFTANVSFSSCRASTAKGSGGAMAVFDKASLTSEQAEVRVHNCSAMKGGGFSIVQSSFTQHGGQLQLHHCSASHQGGGFFLKSGKFEVRGTILVDTCTATSGGGGIFLEDHMQFHVYKDITFSNCRQVGTPLGFGGGLEVHNSDIVQSGGNVVFDGCETAGYGGAAYVHKSRWKLVAGALKVANCTAHGEGGGGFAFSASHLEQFRGEMLFRGCSSQSFGGGIDFWSNSSLKQVGGSIQLQSCEAKLYGGCLTMFQGASFDANGTMRFFNCKSRIKSALYVETNRVTLSTVVVRDGASSDPSELVAVYTSGSLHVKKLKVQNVRDRNFAVSAAAITVHDPFDCQTANQSCLLHAPSVQVAKILCPSGTGLTYVQGKPAGCNVCDRQHMQLKASAFVPCTPCPDEGTKRCEPGQIEMQKGFMVEVLNSDTNDLKVHHCLNPEACPGGLLPHNASMPMCTPGYTGKACLFCEAMHATSDADVLSCVKCANTFWMKTSQFCWIIMKDVLIFLIAYRGGLEAVDSSGKQKDSKTSSILLNQFMAFGSVASIAVLAALNTGGARDLRDKLGPEIWKSVQNLFGLSQELSPGEAGGGISTQCLASYMGLPRSAWMAHILSSVVPLVLILSFATNNVALACIVGSNCFLPAFCASFSKYIVYVQTRKHSTVFTYKDLPESMTPFAGFLCFGSVTLLCFLIAIATWSRVALSKNPKVPPHVAYLRRPYKTGCAMMEVERLSRKMILKTFSAALPITVYPILQLTMVITVMLFPLCLYTHLKPYKKSWLNKSEVFLIISGVIVACLANLITASDQHWSTRPETQEALLLILGFITTAVSFTLGILILVFMYAEFRGGAHVDELDDVM